MKRLFTTLLLAIAGFQFAAYAQTGSVTVFSDKGERFWLLLNGVVQNADPQNNVKISSLADGGYRLKVVFQIDTLGELTTNVNMMNGAGYTYIVKRKNVHPSFRDPKADQRKYERYVIRPFSSTEDGSGGPSSKNQDVIIYGQGQPLNTDAVVKPVHPGTTVTTTTTTRTAKNGSTNPDNFSMNINMDPNSANMSVNVSGTGVNTSTNVSNASSTSTSVTSTTSTTTTHGDEHHGHAHGDGHNHNHGGSTTTMVHAMNTMDFNKAVSSIKGQTFEDNKLMVAKQVLKNNYVNCEQVKAIIGLFTFEESKLVFAKQAYDKTVDKNNYYTLNDAFTYSSSVDELNKFLESK